jgi:hypothetical protein
VQQRDQAAAVPAATGSASGGSLGGASASDLERGYTDCGEERDGYGEAGIAPYDPFPEQRGFLDRPNGWDR